MFPSPLRDGVSTCIREDHMYRYFLAAWAVSIVAAAPLAWAQAAPGNSRADPQDANASVPPVTYESPFANYRVLSDEKMMSWKETNDNVGFEPAQPAR